MIGKKFNAEPPRTLRRAEGRNIALNGRGTKAEKEDGVAAKEHEGIGGG